MAIIHERGLQTDVQLSPQEVDAILRTVGARGFFAQLSNERVNKPDAQQYTLTIGTQFKGDVREVLSPVVTFSSRAES
jgi:acetolactate synthase regulatory subunit